MNANEPTGTPISQHWTLDQIITGLNRAEEKAIPRALTWMQELGSNVLLNWSEDDNLWGCSWVTSGKRITGRSENMTAAIVACLLKFKHRETPYYVTGQCGNRLRHG